MANIQIPIRNDLKRYTFEARLDLDYYLFRVAWNDTEQAWYMDIEDPSGSPLVSGRRLAANQNLLAYLALEEPTGNLYLVDVEGKGEDPGESNLGTRFVLVYQEAE